VNAPAVIGMPLSAVETPALLIELDAFERNLHRMSTSLERTGVRLRPHAKTHKCPHIAHQQQVLGAIGVCCQTVSEAEAMVWGGIRDVLVSNQIVTPAKIARLAALAREARIAVCVDDLQNVQALSRAASAAGAQIDLLVEIDVGTHRCGVAPGEAALALARTIEAAPGLAFAGLQAYHGSAQHTRDFGERRQQILGSIRLAEETRDLLRRGGLECRLLSGGGTGSYLFEAASQVYSELQAGSYIFMDAGYARNRTECGGAFTDFEHSLFVLSTVVSRPVAERAVVDAGLKSLSIDAGLPEVSGLAGARYTRAADEHGIVMLEGDACRIRIGEQMRLIPANCDPTVNLHEWYVVVRDGRVIATWPIVARGPGY
jgi:3-hydroxy-D-aspartate aldolase